MTKREIASRPRAALDYREGAADLRELAALGGDGELVRDLLDLAEEYDLLAEIAEEHDFTE